MRRRAMEENCQRQAAEWLAYTRSAQYRLDQLIDRQRRAAASRRNGHLPSCSLTRCDDRCTSPLASVRIQR